MTFTPKPAVSAGFGEKIEPGPPVGWVTEGYANWQADGLENRCPQGLVGSSPTPSAGLTCAFA